MLETTSDTGNSFSKSKKLWNTVDDVYPCYPPFPAMVITE
jgi:hypothetical protein